MKLIRKAKAPEAGKSLPRVLYVEDNDENWDVILLRLGRSYELLRASSDREACHILSQPNKLAAILMDIELSGSQLNGIQLTKLIRGTLPASSKPDYAGAVPLLKVPVLFVTAYGSAYRRADLLTAGADDVLAKPVDFAQLTRALTNYHINRVLERGAG
jgi:CheY-like chemotaxis protein